MGAVTGDDPVCELRSQEFGSFELRPGGSLRIGRHRENDVVINDTMVSRFHARVTWDKAVDRPVLFDNGSQNGTTVDGQRVRNAHTLRDEARLGFGPYVFRVRLRGLADTPAVLQDTNDLVTLFSDDGPDIEGGLGPTFTVRHLLQRLEAERRTGTLVLQPSAGGRQRVVFCLGRVMSADTQDGKGLRALEQVVLGKGGRFRFSRELEPQEDAINVWISDFLRARGGPAEPTQRFRADDLDRLGGGDARR